MKQEMMGWQWHQMDHMQIICTSLQVDNHACTSSLDFYRLNVLPDAQPTVSTHWRQYYTYNATEKVQLVLKHHNTRPRCAETTYKKLRKSELTDISGTNTSTADQLSRLGQDLRQPKKFTSIHMAENITASEVTKICILLLFGRIAVLCT